MNYIKANIDCRDETISLKFGEEQVKFHFSKFEDKPYRRDLEDKLGRTIAGLTSLFYGTPIDDQEEDLDENDVIESKEEKELGEYLDSTPIIESPMNKEYEEPERNGDEELPPPQLKPLPDGLRYQFLDNSNKYPIIISTDISKEEIIRLLMILRKNRKAFGHSMKDLKGIRPTIETHRIFLEEGAELFQRKLKPQMKEEIRKR